MRRRTSFWEDRFRAETYRKIAWKQFSDAYLTSVVSLMLLLPALYSIVARGGDLGSWSATRWVIFVLLALVSSGIAIFAFFEFRSAWRSSRLATKLENGN